MDLEANSKGNSEAKNPVQNSSPPKPVISSENLHLLNSQLDRLRTELSSVMGSLGQAFAARQDELRDEIEIGRAHV